MPVTLKGLRDCSKRRSIPKYVSNNFIMTVDLEKVSAQCERSFY